MQRRQKSVFQHCWDIEPEVKVSGDQAKFYKVDEVFKVAQFKKEIVAIFPFSFNTILNRLDNYCNQCLQFPNYSQVWKASKVFLKLQECVFSQKKFFLSFNQKEQVIVSEESSCHPSSFATSHPDPRDACGVLCCQKKTQNA